MKTTFGSEETPVVLLYFWCKTVIWDMLEQLRSKELAKRLCEHVGMIKNNSSESQTVHLHSETGGCKPRMWIFGESSGNRKIVPNRKMVHQEASSNFYCLGMQLMSSYELGIKKRKNKSKRITTKVLRISDCAERGFTKGSLLAPSW